MFDRVFGNTIVLLAADEAVSERSRDGDGSARVVERDDDDVGGEREIPLPRPAPRLSAARLAIRLGQDVDAARGGDGGSSRKGWSVRTGGGAGIGAAGTAPSSPPSSGGGWSVVSDKGW